MDIICTFLLGISIYILFVKNKRDLVLIRKHSTAIIFIFSMIYTTSHLISEYNHHIDAKRNAYRIISLDEKVDILKKKLAKSDSINNANQQKIYECEKWLEGYVENANGIER